MLVIKVKKKTIDRKMKTTKVFQKSMGSQIGAAMTTNLYHYSLPSKE